MKKYRFELAFFKLFFVFLISASSVFSQKSYEFGVTLPVESVSVTTTDPVYFGIYQSSKGPQLSYEVNEKGIFIHTINIQAISRETIREDSRYEVRNEHIFGVTEDSIPCVFQDDNYYFGVRNSVQLAGSESENKLIPNGTGTYILNFKSDNGYTPALVEFRNNQLNISHFDYDEEGKLFKKVKDQQTVESRESNLTTIILLPTLREWQKISKKELFGEANVFHKELFGNN